MTLSKEVAELEVQQEREDEDHEDAIDSDEDSEARQIREDEDHGTVTDSDDDLGDIVSIYNIVFSATHDDNDIEGYHSADRITFRKEDASYTVHFRYGCYRSTFECTTLDGEETFELGYPPSWIDENGSCRREMTGLELEWKDVRDDRGHRVCYFLLNLALMTHPNALSPAYVEGWAIRETGENRAERDIILSIGEKERLGPLPEGMARLRE